MSEFRRLAGEDSIRSAIEEKDLRLTLELERSIFVIPFFPEGARDVHALRDGVRVAEERAEVLTKKLSENGRIMGKEGEIIDKIKVLRSSLDDVKILLGRSDFFTPDVTRKFSNEVERLYDSSRSFSQAVFKIHERETGLLIDRIDKNQKERGILVLFIVFSGLGLIVVLVRAVQHYKENADRAQEAEKVNALFASALQSTKVGVLIRDMRRPGSPVVFVNKAFKEMTGYELEEIPQGEVEFLFGWKTDPGAVSAFRRALSLRESATFNVMVYRKDGAPFWSEWHLSPILGEDGEVASFVSVFTDTTLFRQTQEDLLQAKNVAERASAIKTNFLAMMSHEIRTPINGIQGVLRLLEETPMDGEQKNLLGVAMTSSQVLHRIINDILDYAKMEAGKIEVLLEVFSLQKVVEDVENLARPLIGKKEVQFSAQTADDLPPFFFGDSGRIRQILLNLVGNAIKFTQEGSVSLRVFGLMDQDIDGRKGLLVRFEIQDSGSGITAEDQSRLFQEFTQLEPGHRGTRHFGGTGLGLAICKRLVGLLNGEIGVESQPGKGSKFWFMLPLELSSGVPETVEVEESQEKEDDGLLRVPQECAILLAEDNDTNRLVVRAYLQKAGFIVDEAVNGVAALAMAKERKYDLILMDVSMPEMDGLEATEQIRALDGPNADVPIVALTAHVMSGDRELCLAAGMNDHLTKPIEYSVLLKTLKQWIRVNVSSRKPPSVEAEATVVPPAAFREAPPLPQNFVFEGSQDKGSSSQLSDFNPRPLEKMRADLGTAAVKQILDTFLGDSSKRIAGLSASELESVLSSAHTLKSSSANCGLLRFSVAMAEIEQLAAKGARHQIDQKLAAALLCYENGITQLRAYREAFVD